jgi:hypothetical protein
MGKTFKRNSFRKPKQHGRTFEKKTKADKGWKHSSNFVDVSVLEVDRFGNNESR